MHECMPLQTVHSGRRQHLRPADSTVGINMPGRSLPAPVTPTPEVFLARPVVAAGMLYITQFHLGEPSAVMVFIVSANSCVPAGLLYQARAGEEPAASQVYSYGRDPPSVKAELVSEKEPEFTVTEWLAEVEPALLPAVRVTVYVPEEE